MTILVERDGIETDNQSKQKIYKFTQHGSPIIKVTANVPNYLRNCAVIENLIIDGENAAGTIGILLEDVYNCYIRNVTIKDCEIGIQIKNTHVDGSQANRFEHVQILNVKTGLDFTGINGNVNDYSYTTIDHVGIRLKNRFDSNAVGVRVGSDAKLNNAFIKVNVWLDSSCGTGMVVGGQLKCGLVNFRVEQYSGVYSGWGVVIESGATVLDNQSFLLTSLGISANPEYRVVNNGTYDNKIVKVP